MKIRFLALSLSFLVAVSSIMGQENKPKPTLFGDFKGFYQTNLTKNTGEFTLNAARIGAKGSLNDLISYKVLVNFATLGSLTTKKNNDGSITEVKAKFGEVLQDAAVTLNFEKNFTFTMGQFKIPFGTDNLKSPLQIDFVNRPLLTKVTPELRDVGGNFMYSNESLIPIELQAGIFNGAGANKVETDRTLNYAFRGVFKVIPQVSVSANYYGGRLTNSDVNIIDFGTTVKVDNFQFDAEYAMRDADSLNMDFKRKSFSIYTYALYTFKVPTKYFQGIQPAVRYEYFEPDDNLTDNEQSRFTVGLSFLLNANSVNQIKINYEILDYKASNIDAVKKLYIALQTAF